MEVTFYHKKAIVVVNG